MAGKSSFDKWIDLDSVQVHATADTLNFIDASADKGDAYPGFTGGVTVAAGDVNDAPPPSTPTGTVTFFINGLHDAGTYALDQDLLLS